MSETTGTEVLCESFYGLFDDPRYSDFTVECGGRLWKVHRAIICARSTYFDKVCGGAFKEAAQGRIKLDDDDPDVVHGMLSFLYTAGYADAVQSEGGKDCQPMCYNLAMYLLADKYDLQELSDLAKTRLLRLADFYWRTSDFGNAVYNIYTTDLPIDSLLRMEVVKIICLNYEDIFKAMEPHGRRLREVIREVPELGFEVCMAVARDKAAESSAHLEEDMVSTGMYACCNRNACGKVFYMEDPPVVGTDYTCPFCECQSAGEVLINGRADALTLLRQARHNRI